MTNDEGGRKDVHEIIYGIVVKHNNSASLEDIEKEGQAIKTVSAGHYSRIAKADFVLSQKGMVQPKISDKGMEREVKYAARRGVIRFAVSKFPDQAKKTAEKLNVKLPAATSSAAFADESGHVVGSRGCPKCTEEMNRKASEPLPADAASLLGEITKSHSELRIAPELVPTAKLLEDRGRVYLFERSNGVFAQLHPDLRAQDTNSKWNAENPSYQVDTRTGERVR